MADMNRHQPVASASRETPNFGDPVYGELGRSILARFRNTPEPDKVSDSQYQDRLLEFDETSDFDEMLNIFNDANTDTQTRKKLADFICRIVQPHLIESQEYPDGPIKSDTSKYYLAKIYALKDPKEIRSLIPLIFLGTNGDNPEISPVEALVLDRIIKNSTTNKL